MKNTVKGAALVIAAVMVSVMTIGCGNNQGQPVDTPESKGSAAQEAVSGSGAQTGKAMGGTWEYTDPAAMPEDLLEVFGKAFETYTASSVFEPIALLGTQVVAGTNFAILIKEFPSEAPDDVTLKVVTVYRDLKGNCSISGFVPMDLDELYAKAVIPSGSEEADFERGTLIAGGWTPHLEGPELPKDVADFFSAYESAEKQQQMVYLGSRTADGETVYAALKMLSAPEEAMQTEPLQICFVTVKDGAAVSEKVLPVDIADYSSYGGIEEN